jgi:Ser-tRNA(Ala) deacylase AlaX
LSIEVIYYNLERSKAKEIVDLSLVPESIKEIKIYEIVGFNKLACAGPHVKNTKEIGKFEILNIKKKKRNIFSIRFTVIENSDNYVTSKSEFSNKTISKKGDLIKEIVYK